jgi:hypothetical protein
MVHHVWSNGNKESPYKIKRAYDTLQVYRNLWLLMSLSATNFQVDRSKC